MHTAMPVNPASITGPSHQIGRPVATTTRAPAAAARLSASMLRSLIFIPDSSSRVPSRSVTTIAGASAGWRTRRADVEASGAVTGSFCPDPDRRPTPSVRQRSGVVPTKGSISANGGFFVLHLLRVEVHRSARRHRVADEDIGHAYEHATV